MSYQMWINYGYGICVDDIKECSVERLEKLLALAPELQTRMQDWLAKNNVTTPCWEDYMSYDRDYYLGLAVILQEAIQEIEGIELTACDDFDSADYLIYQPMYPWNLSDRDRGLTEESLREMFNRYVAVLTDEPVPVDHQSVENGG